MSQVVNTSRTFHFDQWELKCLSAPCELWESFSLQGPTSSFNLVEVPSYANASCIQRPTEVLCRFLALFLHCSFLAKTLPSTSNCLHFPEFQSASSIQQDPLVLLGFPPCTTIWNSLPGKKAG